MTVHVQAVKVYSGIQRTASIELKDGWTSNRARFSDLPEDMQKALRKWMEDQS